MNNFKYINGNSLWLEEDNDINIFLENLSQRYVTYINDIKNNFLYHYLWNLYHQVVFFKMHHSTSDYIKENYEKFILIIKSFVNYLDILESENSEWFINFLEKQYENSRLDSTWDLLDSIKVLEMYNKNNKTKENINEENINENNIREKLIYISKEYQKLIKDNQFNNDFIMNYIWNLYMSLNYVIEVNSEDFLKKHFNSIVENYTTLEEYIKILNSKIKSSFYFFLKNEFNFKKDDMRKWELDSIEALKKFKIEFIKSYKTIIDENYNEIKDVIKWKGHLEHYLLNLHNNLKLYYELIEDMNNQWDYSEEEDFIINNFYVFYENINNLSTFMEYLNSDETNDFELFLIKEHSSHDWEFTIWKVIEKYKKIRKKDEENIDKIKNKVHKIIN